MIKEIEKEDVKKYLEFREKDSHKGMFGTVGIIGGSIEYLGAVKLASMSEASIRMGTGISRVIISKKLVPLVSPMLLEQTIYPVDCNENNHMVLSDSFKESIKDTKALVIGMGWNKDDEYIPILEYIFENYYGNVVIDADGLNMLSKMDKIKLKNAKCKIILTPHLKEFERLSGIDIEKIKEDSIDIAINFAKENNVILLLKGSTTIVTDGNETYMVRRGCPGMATAGSGDVLSGALVGFLGYNDASAKLVASVAYIVGVAGELAQEKYTDISMKASDTIEHIPTAIKELRL